jgi:hypothetical protein
MQIPPLVIAAEQGRVTTVRLLLDNAADPNISFCVGLKRKRFTPISYLRWRMTPTSTAFSSSSVDNQAEARYETIIRILKEYGGKG